MMGTASFVIILMLLIGIVANWKGAKTKEKVYVSFFLLFLLLGLLSFLNMIE